VSGGRAERRTVVDRTAVRRAAVRAAAACLTSAVTVAGRAQTPRRAPARCTGQRISDVVVVAQPPYMNSLLGRFAFVERTVRKLHATTRGSLVARFLLLHPGDRCDELRRAESERILRAQPYLVDARITPYDDGTGGVLLEVETRDEFSAIVQVAAKAGTPVVRDFRLGEANLAGRGLYTSAEWRDGGTGYRDAFVGRLTDYQFLGRPYQLTLQAARQPVGQNWWGDLTLPFYTDLQRVAWRAAAGREADYLELLRPVDEPNALFFRRRYASIGGVARIGVPGRLSLFGISLSAERAETEPRVAVLSDSGEVADAGQPIGFAPAERYPGQRNVRLNSLWGIRNVRFLGATGFDALTGRQDVRVGFQLGTVVGRGLASLGSRDDDIFTSADAYVGVGTARNFAAAEVRGEGRNDYDRNRWDGIVVTGRAAWYLVPDTRWRTVTSVEYGGVWNPRIPVQLRLGALDGGVRGFHDSRAAGARRVVARLEERRVLGTPFDLGDVGVAAFVDAGRTFAGNAPYGQQSGTQAAAGVGVLGAFPPRSRRLWRLDVAVPVTRSPDAKVQFILSNRDLTRVFWREPRDLVRSREQAVPASVFNWP
jgi:hypothetical protein